MKIKELIERLKEFDPEKMVVISGYEGGLNEIKDISEIKLKLNVNTEWYFGKHAEDENGECEAIYIGD